MNTAPRSPVTTSPISHLILAKIKNASVRMAQCAPCSRYTRSFNVHF